ncbi:MAG: radical SAM protein [Acidimicrobiales bacterium]
MEGQAVGYFRTRDKLLTRRGVLWLGQTCNLRCHFCYFLDRIEDHTHPEHAFMELDKAKAICRELRYRYGNTSVDIQGGEPTVYRHIDAIVAYCREIGLAPTLITNAIVLARRERCERLKAAGLQDLKISVQGLGDVYDEVVGLRGGAAKQAQALQNCLELGIPVRINCAMTVNVLPQLVAISELAVATGALAVNFLALNPFQDQSTGRRVATNVPRYRSVAVELEKALDVLATAGVEANVRYLPLCMAPERHRKSMYNMQQLPYDAQEWDYDSWTWTDQVAQRMKGGGLSAHHPSLAAITYGSPLFTARQREARTGLAARMRSAGRRALRPFPRLTRALRAVERHLAQRRQQTRRRQRDEFPDELGRDPQVYRDNAIVRSIGTDYRFTPQCDQCDVKPICDGFHSDYAALFGTSEAEPIRIGRTVTDPLLYIREQAKVYDAAESSRPFRHLEPVTIASRGRVVSVPGGREPDESPVVLGRRSGVSASAAPPSPPAP